MDVSTDDIHLLSANASASGVNLREREIHDTFRFERVRMLAPDALSGSRNPKSYAK